MAAAAALIDSNIPNLKLLSKGKVRDIYATSSPEFLLFVASDRISAYDVILKNVNYHLIPSLHPGPSDAHSLNVIMASRIAREFRTKDASSRNSRSFGSTN
jgi:hypothetical protein